MSLRVGMALVAAGGAVGALGRWTLTEGWASAPTAFPWPVFWINVGGSVLLALLPAAAVVRRSSWLPVFLGTGVLGGFTTMSTASEQTAALLESGHAETALAYCAGTVLAALSGVWLADRLSTPRARQDFAEREGDE